MVNPKLEEGSKKSYDELKSNAKQGIECEWDEPMASELHQLLTSNLKEAFESAMKTIVVEHGYSEEEAKRAVLSSTSTCLYIGNNKDITSNIVSALLTNKNDFEPQLFDSVECLADFVLVEMVNVITNVKPYLTVAEAMWLLLICDLNLSHATAPQQGETHCNQFSSNGENKVCVEKHELILRKQELQREIQGWTDWTSAKIREATQRLSKDKDELTMLRKEKQEQEAHKLPNDYNIEKRLCQIEAAKLQARLKVAIYYHRRLQEENAKLSKEMADSKLKSEHSSKNLEEAKLKEQELLKQCRILEGENSILLQDHVALKGKGANLQVQIAKATRRLNEIQALWRHEEREKAKFVRKAESLKSETKQLMDLAKAEEENLRAKAEANKLKFEERINKLTTEISSIKLAAVGSSSGTRRDRECAMCLTEEKSVVFIPCAHQILCKDCSALHEKQGMNECPFCRAPIAKRIIARFASPKALYNV